MNAPSTERVRRYRQRQSKAGRKRVVLYIDAETHHKLEQLAGPGAQARFLETLVKAAIEREWAALETRQKDDQPTEMARTTAKHSWQDMEDAMPLFPGRRRSFVSG